MSDCRGKRAEIGVYDDAMSCKFCKKIWSSTEAFEESDLCINECGIVLKDKKTWLCDVNRFGDVIYWVDDLMQINFCPICGRKLTEEDEI